MGFNCETNAWLIQIQYTTKECTVDDKALSHLLNKIPWPFILFLVISITLTFFCGEGSLLVTARSYLLCRSPTRFQRFPKCIYFHVSARAKDSQLRPLFDFFLFKL